MIYASLKPVREWRQPLVPPVYLAFALMTGALLLHALLLLFGAARGWAAALALLATALAFGLKGAYWAAIGRAEAGPDARERDRPGRAARSACSSRPIPRPTTC